MNTYDYVEKLLRLKKEEIKRLQQEKQVLEDWLDYNNYPVNGREP